MNPAHDKRPATPRKTISDRLLEGIVLVVLLAAIFAFFAPKVRVEGGEPPQIAATKADLSILSNALQNFRLDCNRYPTTVEGLDALRVAPKGCAGWRGPYLKVAISKDAWGNPYHYEYLGASGKDSFLLESFGSDGKPGGDGEAADIIEGG